MYVFLEEKTSLFGAREYAEQHHRENSITNVLIENSQYL